MGRISGPLEHVRTPYVPYPLWEGRGNCFPWVFSARSGLPRPGSPFPHTEAPRDGSSSNTVPSPPAGSPPPSGSLLLPAGPSGVELPKQACVQAAWALSGQSGGLGPLPHSGSRTGIE